MTDAEVAVDDAIGAEAEPTEAVAEEAPVEAAAEAAPDQHEEQE